MDARQCQLKETESVERDKHMKLDCISTAEWLQGHY